MNQVKTKIIATLGPCTSSRETLKKIILKGVRIVRLNFSHGTHEEHKRRIELVRSIEEETGIAVTILQDLSGPKIRIGEIKDEPLQLKRGDRIILTTEEGDGRKKIHINFSQFPQEVRKGEKVLLNDGAIVLKVLGIEEAEVKAEVVVGGELTSRKGVNLPNTALSIPALTEKDKEDAIFGIKAGVDIMALSFVRRAEDILELKDILAKHNYTLPVIAKIEKPQALKYIDSIIDASDGIMVARGDLGVEIPLYRVPVIQKLLIKKAHQKGKVVITATQMLKSMVDNPSPTRAEVTDVANAVLDGSDAVMLSEETAVGRYPVKTIQMMRNIIREAEKVYPHEEMCRSTEHFDIQHSLCHVACKVAEETNIKTIIAFTRTGTTARVLSKFRPRVPVIAATYDIDTYHRLNMLWGTIPLLTGLVDSTDKMVETSIKEALKKKYIKKGDKVLILAGAPVGVPGSTNMLKVVEA